MTRFLVLSTLILVVSVSIAQKSIPNFGDPTRFVQLGEIRPKFSFIRQNHNDNVVEISNDVLTSIASTPIRINSEAPQKSTQKFGAVHVRAVTQRISSHGPFRQPPPFARSSQVPQRANNNNIGSNQVINSRASNDAVTSVKNRRAILQNDAVSSLNVPSHPAKRPFVANDSLPGSRSLFGPFGGPGGPPPGAFIGGGGQFIGGPASGALIGGGPFPPPLPIGAGPTGPGGIPLEQQKYYKYEHFLTQVGPFQKVHSKVEKRSEGQTFDPITGVHQFNHGEGQVRDFDNSATLGLGGPLTGPFLGGGPIPQPFGGAGLEFTGEVPVGGPGPILRGGGQPFLPPNCQCRLIADCRDVSALARQLPVSGPNDPTACIPGYVPCCSEPHFETSAPLLRGPPPPPPPPPSGGAFLANAQIEPIIANSGPPLPPPPPPPPYVVKPEGCGLKGTNPLARVLDIEANDPKFADAEFGEFPWMAAILRADHTYACGGALIKPRAVLTAAHCVSKLKFDDIIVRLGEYDVESTQELPYQDILVTQVVIHGGYHSGTLANDVAVLILAEPARLSSYIRPVCLPPFHDYLSFKCTVTGWGKNLPNGQFSRVLKKVDLPIVDHGFCENEYRKSPELGPFFNLDHSFICAGAPGKDACYGDGGAPLVCEFEGFWRLVGLVSWGIGCGQYPGVYIDLTKFVPWIYDVFAKYSFLA